MKDSVKIAAWLLGALLAYVPACFGETGEIYKWQDKLGVTRYSDQMPPPSARNVQKYKKTAHGLVLVKPEPAPAAEEPQPRPEPAEAGAAPPGASGEERGIVLFSFEECGLACREAEEFLNQRGVPYTLRNKEEDKLELRKRTGKLEAPVIYVGKEMRSGFQAGIWNDLLEAAGYGKAKGAIKADGKPVAPATVPRVPAF